MMFLQRFKLCFVLFFKLIRLFFQILYGSWRVSGLPKPIITIFGGARLAKGDLYIKQANQIGQWLVEHNISVLTGGGPGVMEAASYGALEKKGGTGKSMGIGVKNLGEGRNPYVQEYFQLDYFFARKWLLTRFSKAFIVFPGGFGTMDELTEILTLIQTEKMERMPIVLIGKEFWKPFMKWIKEEALVHGTIDKKDLDLFSLTDDLYKAFCFVRDECKI